MMDEVEAKPGLDADGRGRGAIVAPGRNVIETAIHAMQQERAPDCTIGTHRGHGSYLPGFLDQRD